MADDAPPVHDEPVLARVRDEAEQAQREAAVRSREIFSRANWVEELADGCACCIPAPDDLLATLFAWVAFERRCRPFCTFEPTVEPNLGPPWLRLPGSTANKAIAHAAFDVYLRVDLAAVAASRDGGRAAWLRARPSGARDPGAGGSGGATSPP